MTAELVDEPDLVQAVAKLAAQLPTPLARKVIDLCSACFDAGVAHGFVTKIVQSPALTAALAKARRAVNEGPEAPFR